MSALFLASPTWSYKSHKLVMEVREVGEPGLWSWPVWLWTLLLLLFGESSQDVVQPGDDLPVPPLPHHLSPPPLLADLLLSKPDSPDQALKTKVVRHHCQTSQISCWTDHHSLGKVSQTKQQMMDRP